MRLGLFDFDSTVTRVHTFKNPEAYKPASNTKAGVSDYLQLDDGYMSAIVTYHDQPEYVLSYIQAMHADKTFTLVEAMVVEEHCQLTVYSVEGCNYPFIIATIPAGDEFERHHAELKGAGKNVHIMAVLNYLNEKHGLKVEVLEGIEFYDDDDFNVTKARELGIEQLKAYTIDPLSSRFGVPPLSPCQLPYRANASSAVDDSAGNFDFLRFFQPEVDERSSDSDSDCAQDEEEGWIVPSSDQDEEDGWVLPPP